MSSLNDDPKDSATASRALIDRWTAKLAVREAEKKKGAPKDARRAACRRD